MSKEGNSGGFLPWNFLYNSIVLTTQLETEHVRVIIIGQLLTGDMLASTLCRQSFEQRGASEEGQPHRT